MKRDSRKRRGSLSEVCLVVVVVVVVVAVVVVVVVGSSRSSSAPSDRSELRRVQRPTY